MITDLIALRCAYHGLSEVLLKSGIVPVPLMESTLSQERVHVRFPPQVPEAMRQGVLPPIAWIVPKSFQTIAARYAARLSAGTWSVQEEMFTPSNTYSSIACGVVA